MCGGGERESGHKACFLKEEQKSRMSETMKSETTEVTQTLTKAQKEHAKIMAKLLVKNMRLYEEQLGKIPLPADLYRELGIEEDW